VHYSVNLADIVNINDVTHPINPPLACATWAGTPLKVPHIIFWLWRWFGKCTRLRLPLGLNILISKWPNSSKRWVRKIFGVRQILSLQRSFELSLTNSPMRQTLLRPCTYYHIPSIRGGNSAMAAWQHMQFCIHNNEFNWARLCLDYWAMAGGVDCPDPQQGKSNPGPQQ